MYWPISFYLTLAWNIDGHLIRYFRTFSLIYSKFSKIPKTGFQDKLSLNAGQKYCRMFQGGAFCNTFDLPLEHSAILLTFIKLPFVKKIFVLFFLSGRFTQVLL